MPTSRITSTPQRRLLAALAALSLAGCAAVASKTPEDIVRARAAERAAAFVKGDLDASYNLMEPSYRKLRDVNTYKRSFGSAARWEKAEVKGVSCEAERCKVAMAVNVKPLIPGRFGDTISVQFEETWLLEEGNWWLHQGL